MLITERALVQRLNRKLAKESWPKRICKSRPAARQNLGDWYVLNIYNNSIYMSRLQGRHLVDMAKDLGVIGELEQLAPAA